MLFHFENFLQLKAGILSFSRLGYLVVMLTVTLVSPECFAQEFEITLPEGYKPNRFVQRGKDLPSSKKERKSSNKKSSITDQLGKVELYLFSKTSEGQSEIRRLEIIERVLYGTIGNGGLAGRVEKVFKTVSSGSVRVKEGIIPEKIERDDPRKWWHFGGNKRFNKDFKLVRDGRSFYKAGKWEKAKDKFSQVLMIEPANIEAIFKVAVCDFYLCSNPKVGTPTFSIDERLVTAREKLVTAKRLFVLSGNTKQALEATKFIDKIDARRQKSAGPVKQF